MTTLAQAVFAPGLTLDNIPDVTATILASAPAKGTMPRTIVLASIVHPGNARIVEYVTWEADCSLIAGTVSCYWGAYFPVNGSNGRDALTEAMASFVGRTGTHAAMADALGAH